MNRKLIIFPASLLLGYLATGLFQVQPGERAVVRRFGAVLAEPRLPGLNYGLPWGLDRVDRIAVDEQRRIIVGFEDIDQELLDEAPPGQVLTGDQNLADVRLDVFYRVEPGENGVVQFALNERRLESHLIRAVEHAMSTVLAGQEIDALLLGRTAGLEARIQDVLASSLTPYQLGILIESINLTYAQPPTELTEVFREVNRARTQMELVEREAELARETVLSVARNDARRIANDARAESHRRISQAQAEARSFLLLWDQFSRYDTDRNNALLNLYLSEMQPILGRMKVRTISDDRVDQTIVMPVAD